MSMTCYHEKMTVNEAKLKRLDVKVRGKDEMKQSHVNCRTGQGKLQHRKEMDDCFMRTWYEG